MAIERYVKLFIFLLLFFVTTHAYSQASGKTFNVPSAINGQGGITGIFVSTVVPPTDLPNVWNLVDVTALGLPPGTIAINLGGFFIVTNGQNQGISNLTIAFRTPGDAGVNCSGNYIGQAISVNPPADNGTRELGNFWIKLSNNRFEWCWQRGIVGLSFPDGALQSWPTDPAFAINLNIEAWITP